MYPYSLQTMHTLFLSWLIVSILLLEQTCLERLSTRSLRLKLKLVYTQGGETEQIIRKVYHMKKRNINIDF